MSTSSAESNGSSACIGCCDNHEYCAFWANEGECTNNPQYMQSICKLSCRLCSTSLEQADTTILDSTQTSDDPAIEFEQCDPNQSISDLNMDMNTTTTIMEYRYRLGVPTTTSSSNALEIFSVIYAVENAIQDAILDEFCGQEHHSYANETEEEKAMSVSTEPPDFPIGTCGENCFEILGQTTVKTATAITADQTVNEEFLMAGKCNVVHIIYDFLQNQGKDLEWYATSDQLAFLKRCNLVLKDHSPQEDEVVTTSSSTLNASVTVGICVSLVAFAIFALTCLLYKKKNMNSTTRKEVSSVEIKNKTDVAAPKKMRVIFFPHGLLSRFGFKRRFPKPGELPDPDPDPDLKIKAVATDEESEEEYADYAGYWTSVIPDSSSQNSVVSGLSLSVLGVDSLTTEGVKQIT